MKLSKATELTENLRHEEIITRDSDLFDALTLAIEALKRCQVLAKESSLWALHPLPGETPGEPQDTAFKHTTSNHHPVGSQS